MCCQLCHMVLLPMLNFIIFRIITPVLYHNFIDAQAIVFGCPAALDLEQSVGTKDYITSVVSDADVITRMSGPSIANMFLDIHVSRLDRHGVGGSRTVD